MLKENPNTVETIIKTGEESNNRSRLTGFQRLRECGLILGILSSILLAVALLSFNPADPSWSQTAWGGSVNNAGGLVGAWIADTLFFTFGSLAYPIPIILTAATWISFRNRGEDERIDFMIWGTRLLGLALLILTGCGLADINFDDIWYFSSGGVVGDVLTSLAMPTLNVLGSTLVFLFLWGAGFTLLTGISWLTIVEWLGNGAIDGFSWVVNKVRGEKDETFKPQLKEAESEVETTEDDSAPFSIRMEQDEDVELPLVPAAAEQNEVSIEKRHFNIHMPSTSTQPSGAQTNNSPIEDRVHAAPVSRDGGLPSSFEPERNKQLGSTIDQLEQDAIAHDDYAQQEERIAQNDLASKTIDDSAYAHDEATSVLEISDIDEPLISMDTLQQIAQESEAPHHTEPTAEQISVAVESTQQELAVQAAEPVAVEQVAQPTPIVEPIVEEQPTYTPEPQVIEPVVEERVFDEPNLEPQGFEEVVPQQHVESDASTPVFEEVTEQITEEAPQAHQDADVAAFQNIVSEAQANMAAEQNPFLVQKEPNLPKPTSPMPTLELLYHPEKRDNFIDRDALEEIARLVEAKLADYKIKAEVVDIFPGPVITRFELDLAPGVKVSRISSLSMDLARSLSAMAVRVVEVIPGKPYVGLELPNMSRQTVFFSDVVGSQQFIEAKSPTTVVMGQDIAGEAVIADIAKMPHVLVAGTTGSGKSVGVNVMILSMLYKATPEDLRFIMIDPKMLELSIYEGIPHLLSEVVTDMKDASNALRWCVGEMERRYKLMSAVGVRNLKGYNDKLKMAAEAGHPIRDPLWQPGDSMDPEAPLLEKLPTIVVVVDEFADLMMVVGKKVEELIARLAQKARAAGIHLILATQRPSVDVITGLIKANIPTRVAFTVSTKTDSRTILDQGGAESLLGMGDMLYLPPGSSHTMRVHGAFASDDDVHAVVNDWKARGKPQYIDEITNGEQTADTLLPGEKMEGDEDVDPLFDQVVEHVTETRRGSVSGVQRKFKIGYNRAARIVEQLEAQGIVSAPGHNGNREVLAPPPIKD